jgi:hypothetical protein
MRREVRAIVGAELDIMREARIFGEERARLRRLLEIQRAALKPIRPPKDYTPPRYDEDYRELMRTLDADE